MTKLEYEPKNEIIKIAREVIDFLRPKELPVWQVKEVLSSAAKLADWEKLK